MKGQIRKQHLTYNTEIWATREENTPRTCTGIPVYKHYFKDYVNHMLPTVHIKITMLKWYWGRKKPNKTKTNSFSRDIKNQNKVAGYRQYLTVKLNKALTIPVYEVLHYLKHAWGTNEHLTDLTLNTLTCRNTTLF